MITEDYVSFPISKLLKEKGYKGSFNGYYNNAGCVVDKPNTLLKEPKYQYYERVSLYMTMKWLREVHNLHIAILWDCGAYIGKNSFCYHIDRMDNYEDKGYNKIGFDSYEEACEVAIKYSLENLI